MWRPSPAALLASAPSFITNGPFGIIEAVRLCVAWLVWPPTGQTRYFAVMVDRIAAAGTSGHFLPRPRHSSSCLF